MATVDQNTMEAEVGSQEPSGCSPQVVLHLPALFFFFFPEINLEKINGQRKKPTTYLRQIK